MAAKKKTTKKKEPTWDEIGKLIGQKVEKGIDSIDTDECKGNSWKRPWMMHHEQGGGFGRFVFIIGVLWALSSMGYLVGIELWQLAIIVIGFSMMRF